MVPHDFKNQFLIKISHNHSKHCLVQNEANSLQPVISTVILRNKVSLTPQFLNLESLFPDVLQNFSVSALFENHISHLKPCLKGDVIALKISKNEYEACIAKCANILYGRIIWFKGDKPY